MLEAFGLAHEAITQALRRPARAARQAGKPKWDDAGVAGRDRVAPRRALRRAAGRARPGRHRRRRDRDPRRRAASRGSRRRRGGDGAPHAGRARPCASSPRSAAPRPSRAPCATVRRRRSRASDAEQDSKELKSAKRAALFERIEERAAAAVPVARRGWARHARHGRGRARPRSTPSTSRSCARRSRSRSAGPTAAQRPRSARSAARSV